jgi:hypothetical protein
VGEDEDNGHEPGREAGGGRGSDRYPAEVNLFVSVWVLTPAARDGRDFK